MWIEIVIIPFDLGIVIDEERRGKENTGSLNDLPSDVAEMVDSDITHAAITDDMAGVNPPELSVIF